MKYLFLSIVFVCFTACATTAPAINSNQQQQQYKEEKFLIMVEGLETEYIAAVLDALRDTDLYVRDSVTITKDGYMESLFRFKDTPKTKQEITSKLNTVFMMLSRTIEIRTTIDTFKVIVTD